MEERPQYQWRNWESLEPVSFKCGHCGHNVGADHGFRQHDPSGAFTGARIYICGFCRRPTFFEGQRQIPGSPFGAAIEHLDQELGALYDEARNAMAVNAFTAAVLASRKILMHVAVDRGAKRGQSFLSYVGFLQKNGHIPPGSKIWVDHIREKGNEANHEIRLSSRDEAELLLRFVEMLLRITYEFPRKVPGATTHEDLMEATE